MEWDELPQEVRDRYREQQRRQVPAPPQKEGQ